MEHLHVQMLGDFSFREGENLISDLQNRTKKVWLLLAYILCKRGQIVSRKELIQLLWGEDATSNNPENALKITFYRVRSLLDQLEPNAGHQLVIWQDNGYTWNIDIPMTLDVEEFERLCNTVCQTESGQLENNLAALELYKGDFLSNLPNDEWLEVLRNQYHNLYIQKIMDTVPMLLSCNRAKEAISILKKAVITEIYNEPLHQLLMQAHMANSDQSSAISVYETLSQRLFSDFGTKPGDDIYACYREIMHTLTNQSLSMDMVLDYLLTNNSGAGALQCDYDYFKILCHSEARVNARSGKNSHIALLSVSGKGEKILTKPLLEQTMERLSKHICLGLRRGDAYTQCSMNQYIIMLREANYENSCMVSQRIISSFNKAYPRSSATITFSVELLTPSTVIR